MKIIKLAFISLVVFSIIITGISLLIPSHIRLSRTEDILTDKSRLLEQLKDLRNWNAWYPGLDSSGMNTGNGSSNQNSLATMGNTRLSMVSDSLIVAVTENGERNFINRWVIFPGMRPGSYTLQWFMDFNLRWYPWEKFSSMMFENRYGKQMEAGLQNLKTLLED